MKKMYMGKPNFRVIGQAAKEWISGLVRKRRETRRNYLEAKSAADAHVVMSKEEARRMGGDWLTRRKRDRRKLLQRVRKQGLGAVVERMEQNVIAYHTRQYQPEEVKIKKRDGSVLVLRGADAERARIPKLEQIDRLSGERRRVLGQCERIIESSDLRRVVDNKRPKTLRQLADSIGRILTGKRPFVGEIRRYKIGPTNYGERFSLSSAGSWTIEHFRDERLSSTDEYRIKPEEINAFKEYYRATRKWLESLDEYSKQEWAEK